MKWYKNSIPENIKFSQIINISKKVSERIKSKYLKHFLITTVSEKNIKIDNFTKIYFTFIIDTNIYEIYVFKSTNKNNIFEMQLFENYYKINDIKPFGYDLFICQDFFVVFFDGKFLLFKENKNYHPSDIEKFIEFNYGIKANNIFSISNKDIDACYTNNLTIQSLKTLDLNKSIENYLFAIYLILVVLVSLYFYYKQNEILQNKFIEDGTKTLEKQTNFKRIVPYLIIFSKNIENSGAQLKIFKYDTKIYALLNGNKDEIYRFLDYYNGKIKVIKFEKDSSDKTIIEVEIDIGMES